MTQPITNPVVDAKPNTVPVVPADWSALGAVTGYNPKPAEALRLFIVGPRNEGKTTLASSIPNNIILDAEDGAGAIVGTNSVRIHVKSYSQLAEIVGKLMDDAKNNNRHWGRVSWDSVDEFIDMIKHRIEEEKNIDEIMEYGSRGAGINLVLQRFWSFVMDLEQAGYVWAIIGHQKTVTEANPVTKKDETKIRESVWPSIAGKIKNKADFQLTAYRIDRAVEKKEKKKIPGGRIIEVSAGVEVKKTFYVNCLTTARGEGKSRGVPDMETKFEIPLVGGWEVFRQKYNTAIEAAKEKYQ